MTGLPSGTVTFVFTDLEGSTRLWEEHPDAMGEALARHDEIVRGAIETTRGVVLATMGDGMAAVFASADDAVAAVLSMQLSLSAQRWGKTGPLRARIGVHTDEGVVFDGQYANRPLNRCARLMSIAHGGQTVLSSTTAELVGGNLPISVDLIDLGEHRLRDLARPVRVFQLHHPDLAVEFLPLRSVDYYPSNLPVVLSSFVGREQDLSRVVTALEHARVVTLVGVGGVGKTRLALHVAAEILPGYADGVWFCELAPVSDRHAVADAIAACVGARRAVDQPTTATLLDFLRNKKLLLVLDNCEHAIASVGSLAEAIVHACPGVAVLATSREALGIEGEILRPLGSLAVPDDEDSPGDISAVASVRLFVDRAQAVRPNFAIDAASGQAVAEICRQLDGVPLAIELAAARVGSLSVNDIARRLDQRFRLLTGGRRTALERHQTLRGAVDWSYELLDETEARLFNRLAVFAGGFTLDSAETVVSADGIESDDVLDVLSRLVARSMVVADESAGTMRYRLLETMRQYARERLDNAGEGDVVRRRHADHYVALAEAAAVGVTGREEERWVRTFDAETANFNAALDWTIGIGEADLSLRLAIALGARPGLQMTLALERAIDMPESRHHPLRPHAMALHGIPALVVSGNLALAADRLRQMDAAFAEAGLELSARAHIAHAAVASTSGDVAGATRHGEASIAVALGAGDRHSAGWNCVTLAMFLASAGDSDRAVELAEQGYAFGVELENPTLRALGHTTIGYALSTVDPDAAIARLESGLPVLRALRNETLRYSAECCLARLLAARGQLGEALEIYFTVLDLSARTGTNLHTFGACDSLAVDLAVAGYGDDAATMFGALEEQRVAYRGNPIVGRGAAIEALRLTMDEASYDESARRGRAMNTDGLVDYTRATLTRILDELGGREAGAS